MNEKTREMIAAIVRETVAQTLAASGARMAPVARPVNVDTLLSEKEREILVYVCRGMTNKEIAELQNGAADTIKNHVAACINKLSLHLGDYPNRTSLAYWGAKNGF